MKIHSLAVVEPGAQLADSVEIGPFAYIGSEVTLGENTVVLHHASIDGWTVIGEDNTIYPYAAIGGRTQDLKYSGGRAGLVIGNRNIFREYVTVHGGTDEGTFTKIGDDNALLAYAHVAHDCTVKNHVIMSSLSALAGYVTVDDYANIAWNSGVHQFCHIGKYAMLAASSKTVMDVLPFMIAEGQPAETRAFNKINLERHGFSKEQIETVKNIFRILFHSKGNRSESLKALEQNRETCPEIYDIVIRALQEATRGFC